MKNLLPTLIPLVSTLVVAVSDTMQHFIGNAVHNHPVLSSIFVLVGLVVNHWIPSPAQTATAQQ